MGRWLLAIAASVLALAASAVTLATSVDATSALVLWAAIMLLAGAQVLRALRLALIATHVLGVSMRAAASLHLSVAPLSILVPFKLAELLRIQQLWTLGRNLSGTLVVVVMERALDAVALIVLIAWLLQGDGRLSDEALAIAVVSCVVGGAALTAFSILPGILREAQRYTLLHHRHPRVFAILSMVDAARHFFSLGGALLTRYWLPLALMTAAIWLAELLATAVIVTYALDTQSVSFAARLTERLSREWRILLLGGADADITLAAQCALAAALALFPAGLALYLNCRRREPKRRLAMKRMGMAVTHDDC